jgi:lysophospholipase L1-like esterase
LLIQDSSGSGPKVGVVGDSLVFQAEYGSTTETPELDHRLTDALVGAGYRAAITAMSAASTSSLGAWGSFVNDDIVVTALGTNDMRINTATGTSYTTLKQATLNLEAHLARVRADCDVLVGIVETPYRGLNVFGPAWNQILRDHADVFVDWARMIQPGWLTADQTHHTTAGQAAYRQAIVDGVNQCP